MECGGQLDQYGVVAYINGELGDFLFQLRGEVVKGCNLRSHVSVLPPRPLAGSEAEADAVLQASRADIDAFAVSLGGIEIFGETDVIYLAIGTGRGDLAAAYGRLNRDALAFTEAHPYHPHVTLAQKMEKETFAEVLELCTRRWSEYQGPHDFAVETLTFVGNIGERGWLDLTETHLELAGSRR